MLLYLQFNVACFCYLLIVLCLIRDDLPDLSNDLIVKTVVALILFVLSPAIVVCNLFLQIVNLIQKVIKWISQI